MELLDDAEVLRVDFHRGARLRQGRHQRCEHKDHEQYGGIAAGAHGWPEQPNRTITLVLRLGSGPLKECCPLASRPARFARGAGHPTIA